MGPQQHGLAAHLEVSHRRDEMRCPDPRAGEKNDAVYLVILLHLVERFPRFGLARDHD
jgi:hypothetical protein